MNEKSWKCWLNSCISRPQVMNEWMKMELMAWLGDSNSHAFIAAGRWMNELMNENIDRDEWLADSTSHTFLEADEWMNRLRMESMKWLGDSTSHAFLEPDGWTNKLKILVQMERPSNSVSYAFQDTLGTVPAHAHTAGGSVCVSWCGTRSARWYSAPRRWSVPSPAEPRTDTHKISHLTWIFHLDDHSLWPMLE